MIYLKLLWSFLKIGLFSFGGAYGAIPLIRDVVLSNGWLSEEMFTYFIAVSESTPGPIMVNMATYVGSSQAGFLGALMATTGVVLPSFVIILILISLMENFIKNKYVQSVLRGIRPCFIGIVFSMGLYMIISNMNISISAHSADWQAVLLTILLIFLSFGYQKIKKRDFSPILFIIISAGMGMIAYAF